MNICTYMCVYDAIIHTDHEDFLETNIQIDREYYKNIQSDSFILLLRLIMERTALEDASKASLQSLDQQLSDLRLGDFWDEIRSAMMEFV